MSLAEFEPQEATINDLPEEVLRHVLSLLSPYGDLKSAMLVCRYWSVLVIGIIQQKSVHFKKAVGDGTLYASHLASENESGAGCTITERYSHCACYVDSDKAMYVFGGCTSPSTTFNDLWRFDLTPKQWIRPLAMGIYPSPKACASMVVHKNSLILFGGWSQPTPFPLHQAARFFSELHIYSTQTNRWSHVVTHRPPPPTAGHSASIIDDQMIVFGGSHGHNNSCNDLWVLDINQMTWCKKEARDSAKLSARYGQSQIVIDKNHILVIGGCGGPNLVYTDIWLLELGDKWSWKEMVVNHSENGPPQPWCRQMCRVGDKVVAVSKGFRPNKDQPGFQVRARPWRTWVPPTQEELQRNARLRPPPGDSSDSSSDESCVNGRMGTFRPPASRGRAVGSASGATAAPSVVLNSGAAFSDSPNRYSDGFPIPLREHTHPGGPSIRPNAASNRQKQLQMLDKYESLLKQKVQSQKQNANTGTPNPMFLHVLDISGAISDGVVTWLPVSECPCEAVETSEEVLFYSLVEGRGELLMFGGLRTDPQGIARTTISPNRVTITNDLFIFMPERIII